MTKKDFTRIAEAIESVLIANTDYTNEESASATAQMEMTISEVVDALAVVFEQDNERFDRARFTEACGF